MALQPSPSESQLSNLGTTGRLSVVIDQLIAIAGGVGAAALSPKGYQQIIGAAAAVAGTVPVGTSVMVVTPEAQGVRYRADGTDPTAAIGVPINAGASWTFKGTQAQLLAIKFIEQAASSTLNFDYYGV